jgi:hypothetical protein
VGLIYDLEVVLFLGVDPLTVHEFSQKARRGGLPELGFIVVLGIEIVIGDPLHFLAFILLLLNLVLILKPHDRVGQVVLHCHLRLREFLFFGFFSLFFRRQ